MKNAEPTKLSDLTPRKADGVRGGLQLSLASVRFPRRTQATVSMNFAKIEPVYRKY